MTTRSPTCWLQPSAPPTESPSCSSCRKMGASLTPSPSGKQAATSSAPSYSGLRLSNRSADTKAPRQKTPVSTVWSNNQISHITSKIGKHALQDAVVAMGETKLCIKNMRLEHTPYDQGRQWQCTWGEYLSLGSWWLGNGGAMHLWNTSKNRLKNLLSTCFQKCWQCITSAMLQTQQTVQVKRMSMVDCPAWCWRVVECGEGIILANRNWGRGFRPFIRILVQTQPSLVLVVNATFSLTQRRREACSQESRAFELKFGLLC